MKELLEKQEFTHPAFAGTSLLTSHSADAVGHRYIQWAADTWRLPGARHLIAAVAAHSRLSPFPAADIMSGDRDTASCGGTRDRGSQAHPGNSG